MASDSLAPYRSAILTANHDARDGDAHASAQRSVHAGFATLAADALNHRLSPREAERIRHTLEPLAQAASAGARLVHSETQMSAEAATFALTVEACAAKIAALRRLREEQELIRGHLPPVIAAEMQARLHAALADAANAQLRHVHATAALEIARRPAHVPRAVPEQPPAEERPPTRAEELRETRRNDRAFNQARLAEEALRIVTRVRNAGPLFDRQHPFDGFAACVYVQGRLDGLTSDKATERAGEALVAELTEGTAFTPSEVQAYERRYKALARELRRGADARTSATLLASVHRIAGAN